MRYLLFSWSNPRLIESIHGFLRHLPSDCHKQSLVVTPQYPAAVHYAAYGYNALSLEQISGAEEDISFIQSEFVLDLLDETSMLDRTLGRSSMELDQSANVYPDYFTNLSLYYMSLYCALFRLINPTITFTWNGRLTLSKSIAVLAHHFGIPCFFMERGLLPDTLFIDAEGVNFASSLAYPRWRADLASPVTTEEMRMLDRECAALHEQHKTVVSGGAVLSSDEVRDCLRIEEGRNVILLILQLEEDSNIVEFSPHYKKMSDVIADVHAAVQQIPNTFLIIKPHPEGIRHLEEWRLWIGTDSNAVFSSDISLHSLIEVSDVVVCVNSTVGFEALTQRRQVVVLGNAVYSQKNFTYDITSRSDLELIIRQALKESSVRKFNTQEFFKFLKYIKQHSLFSLSDEDSWNSREHIIGDILKKSTEISHEHLITQVPEQRIFIETKINELNQFQQLLKKGTQSSPVRVLIHSQRDFTFLQKFFCTLIKAVPSFMLLLKLLCKKGIDVVVIDGKTGWKLELLRILRAKILFISKG